MAIVAELERNCTPYSSLRKFPWSFLIAENEANDSIGRNFRKAFIWALKVKALDCESQDNK